MNAEQAKRIEAHAKGLWAYLTPEQLAVLRDTVAPYDCNRALSVLKTHATKHEYLSLPQLTVALKADADSHAARQRNYHRETVASELRRKLPPDDRRSYAEIIVDHYAAAWKETQQAEDQAGVLVVRKMIRGHCYSALMQINAPADEAAALADSVVGLKEGERLSIPQHLLQFA